MYSSTLRGYNKRMRKQACITLGLWHPFKNACQAVWKTFAAEFFSPAFHVLFPTKLCFMEPKLVSIIVMFTYFRHVYPIIQDELARKIASSNRFPERKTNLLCLRDVFEFYIPTVSCNFV